MLFADGGHEDGGHGPLEEQGGGVGVGDQSELLGVGQGKSLAQVLACLHSFV